jgi:predicted nucleotidyltransferase
MTKQARSVEFLVERCREVDPDCGIQLQGSVARGEERPDSDVDLTVILTVGSLASTNDLIHKNNHMSGSLVHVKECLVDVDINWIREAELAELVRARGAFDWFMFLVGTSVHDPVGAAERSHGLIKNWFDRNPAVLEAWKSQQLEVGRGKREEGHLLQFDTQPKFCEYLRKHFQN